MIGSPQARFRAELTHSGAMAIIAPHGELDLAARPAFEAELERAMARNPLVLAIDLRGLEFLDASGIGALVEGARRCERESRRYFLVRGQPEVQAALDASGVNAMFEIVDRLEGAGDPDPF